MPGIDVPVQTTDPTLQAQANVMASSILRSKNIHEYKSTLVFGGMIVWPNGRPIESATTIMIKGKGIFDGKWIIQWVRVAIHEGKLTTEIELRKCIQQQTAPKALPINQEPKLDPQGNPISGAQVPVAIASRT